MDRSPTTESPDLWQSYSGELTKFLTQKLRSREVAADLVQETYVRVLRLGSSTIIEQPRAFLYRIASNLAVDYLRRSSRQADLITDAESAPDVPSAAPGIDRRIEDRQTLARLEEALGELSPKCRRALLGNRLDGLSHVEIAQELGVSESMVAKYIAQALRHCRDRLRQDD
jgi:RNA polymerase sigma factor (sigma-70 family)